METVLSSDDSPIVIRSRLAKWLAGSSMLIFILCIISTVLIALLYHEYEAPETSTSQATSNPPLISSTSAILVIDVQNDFLTDRTYPSTNSLRYTQSPFITVLPNGTVNVQSGVLGVTNTQNLATGINDFIRRSASYLPKLLFTLDWHPIGHCSFYGNTSIDGVFYVPQSAFNDQQTQWRCHDDKSQKTYSYGNLVQWAPHCEQSAPGARFDPALVVPDGSYIVKKGYEPTLDSYSGLYGRQTFVNFSSVDVVNEGESVLWNNPSTMALLYSLNVRDLIIVGVASDYCVYNSALDGVDYVSRVGGNVYVVADLVRAVNPGDAQAKFLQLQGMGVKIVNSSDFFQSGTK